VATKKTKLGNNPNTTLHIYTRVSTVVQADKGTTLDSQLELGKKKAKELKFSVEHWNEGGKSSAPNKMVPQGPKRVGLEKSKDLIPVSIKSLFLLAKQIVPFILIVILVDMFF
jgi:hypothetical protein